MDQLLGMGEARNKHAMEGSGKSGGASMGSMQAMTVIPQEP